MRKIFLFTFLFTSVTFIYAYDFNPIDFIIDFPKELSIESPYISRVSRLDGKGYQLTIRKKIIFLNNEVVMYIRCNIDEMQIPYSEEARSLLESYYAGENDFNIETLIPKNDKYYNTRISVQSFSERYRARGFQYIDCYESDVIYGQDGIQIERDYTRKYEAEPGVEEKLTYYFKSDKGLYSEYIIEISDIWHFSWDYREFELRMGEPKLKDFSFPGSSYISINELHTMTNEELKNYPDQNNPSIRLMHLLNEAMTTFRFKDRPNIPDSNLGTVNDNRVRVRTEYNLNSETIGHVNTGEEVIVMERSPEKQKIGDMDDYWYRILSKSSYIKGWMYGVFLDLDAKEIDNK